MITIQSQLRQWLPFLLKGKPHQVIGAEHDGHAYLLRWYLLPRNPYLNVYLHKFLRSDDDRAKHDPPWWFASFIVRGEYTEETDNGPIRRRAGSLALRPATHRHIVKLLPVTVRPHCTCPTWGNANWPHRHDCPAIHTRAPEVPCWTLIITGRRLREWGFWCPADRPGDPKVTVHDAGTGQVREVDGERFIPWQGWDYRVGCGEP